MTEENAATPMPNPAEPAAAQPTASDKIGWIPDITKTVILSTLLLVIIFDYFIYQSWGRTDGLGLGALILLVAGLIWLIERPSFSIGGLICEGLLILLAVRSIWQASAWGWITAFILIFIFTSSLKMFSLHITELVHSFCWTGLKLPLILTGYARTILKLSSRFPFWGARLFRLGLIWLIPAVIVLVFIIIFALANSVVASWMTSIWDWVWEQLSHILDYFPSIGHIFFWIFSFISAVILLAPQKLKLTVLTPILGDDEEMKQGSALPFTDLLAAIAINTLVAVNLVFLLYNIVDFSYLWIKKALPQGLSYSEYARSGTLWLTLALALTSLVLGVIFIRDLNFHRRTRLLKILAWIWVAQNLIIAVGTFHRLLMYIDCNGLTRMRIVGAYGILLVVIGLLIVALKMHRVKSFLWMTRRHLLAFSLGLLALVITPMDVVVFKYNVHLILHGNPRSAVQLIVQPITAEGIPALIPLLDCKDETIRKGVAGILLREQENLRQLQDKEQRWVERELSRFNALKEIKSVRSTLEKIIPDGQWQKAINDLNEHTKKWY
ncbi:MAG: DUF4173 domain-containing protein [Planctomycetes bacterium]|nr:DUF4173 domain-containing protein [Planctomycetota bacterium]